MLEMATGQPPWHTLNLRTPVALINWVKRTEGPPPLPESLSQPLTKFLLRCFERDPSKRATAKELLSDPFVAKRRVERVLESKGSAASDADSVVSDIDNLSRTAAIARIRRASMSEYSRPNSDQSVRSAPSPGASGRSIMSPGNGGGGGRGSPASGVERSQSPQRGGGNGGGGRGGGCESVTAVSQQVVTELEDDSTIAGEDGGTSPRRPVPLHSALAPALRVETTGLESQLSAAPRVVTTPPPTRRSSVSRNSPGTPNPFGGKRRSLDTSPDGCGRRCNSSSPRASALSPQVLLSSGGSQPEKVQQTRGRRRSSRSGDNGDDDSREGLVVLMASEKQDSVETAATAGKDDRGCVNTNSSGSNAPPAVECSSSDRSKGGRESGSTDSQEETGGDPPAPVVADAVPDNDISPTVATEEKTEIPAVKAGGGEAPAPAPVAAPASRNMSPVMKVAQEIPSPRSDSVPPVVAAETAAVPADGGKVVLPLKKARSGRGGRPGGRLSAGNAETSVGVGLSSQ